GRPTGRPIQTQPPGHKKKRTQAPPNRVLGDPAERERGLRRVDGGRDRGLSPPTRCGQATGLPRRDLQTTGCRNADAIARPTGSAGAQKRRNTYNTKADWHCTTAYARIKLQRLYPALKRIRFRRRPRDGAA